MISETVKSSRPWMQTNDPDAAYREDLLSLLARLDVKPAQAIVFVEGATGRPFGTCSPAHLVPLLEDVLELLRSHRGPVELRRPCET